MLSPGALRKIQKLQQQGNPYANSLTKLSIEKADDPSSKFEVQVNPSSLTHKHSLNYDKKEVPGKNSQESEYKSAKADSISFKLTLDGTGALQGSTEGVDVSEKITELRDIVFKYQSDKHEPAVVVVKWGETFSFRSRMETMDIEYKMFKPNGDPLRAVINLSFVAHTPANEAARSDSPESPDLSHLIMVKEGDTLPLMCHRIYGDSKMYLQVAQVNNIVNFRHLTPGEELLFPPIKK